MSSYLCLSASAIFRDNFLPRQHPVTAVAVYPDDRALFPQLIVFCVYFGRVVTPDRLTVFDCALIVGVLEVLGVWNRRLSHFGVLRTGTVLGSENLEGNPLLLYRPRGSCPFLPVFLLLEGSLIVLSLFSGLPVVQGVGWFIR